MLRPLLVFGTRPEAIKMAPVVAQCRKRRELVEPIICVTGQHREMLRQVTDYFQLQVDICLDLMVTNQSLAAFTSRCIESLDKVWAETKPDCCVVQGDTTTVMAAALVAFYRGTPVVHVEAGLRTGDIHSPWPEEVNRRIADLVADVYCAPTEEAANRLLREGVAADKVYVTGNTVIDALLETLARERQNGSQWLAKYPQLKGRAMVLVTGHRRESFGRGMEDVCHAIAVLAREYSEKVFLYPVHLNPNVREPVYRLLGKCANVYLVEPATYPEFVWLMDRSELILTDSGGVQEEAPTLRKPILVMRDVTERPEAVKAGAARLVGTSPDRIVMEASRLLTDPVAYAACQIAVNPYGDGKAAERIVDLMLDRFTGRRWMGVTH